MESSSTPHNKSSSETDGFVAAMHGNCVFSDAVSPVTIRHLENGAVVSPIGNAKTGVIHFALPLVLESRKNQDGYLNSIGTLQGLEVDFVQVQDNPGQMEKSPSEVVSAKIFVGCEEYWRSNMYEETSFTVEVKDAVGVMDLRHPKGFGVTLDIKFGEDSLRFCSVAVFGDILKMKSGGIVRPSE